MRYSVWNPGTLEFDYYEGPGAETTNAVKPAHLKARTLGATVDQAAWPLPSDAVRVGAGPLAVGRVAVAKRFGLGDDGGGKNLSLVKAGLLAFAGYVGMKVLMPKRKK
jgi:hypothetical protein